MKILKALSAATSLILIGSTNVAPATQMSTQSAQPEYESATVIEETIEESVCAEIDNDSPTPPYAEKKSYDDSLTIDSNDDTVLTEKIKDPLEDLGPAIVEYYTIPGDMKTYGGTILSFSHYQKVTETADGKNYRLSGWSYDGDWSYIMDMKGAFVSSEGILPFDVYTDCVLSPPLAAVMGPFELNGFTFDCNMEDMTSYYYAYGCIFIEGKDWSAAILDYTHYGEVKYGHQNGNIPDDYNLKYVANYGDYWLMAAGNAPAINPNSDVPKTDFYQEVSEARWSPAGVTDPKYGCIEWGEAAEECNFGGNSVYRINGKLYGTEFTIEIDDADSNGFTVNHDWSAAIIPSNFVSGRNPSRLHIRSYVINVAPDGRTAYVYDETKNEGHTVNLQIPDDEVVLVTITDGKHAVAATFDVALLGLIWNLA